MLLLLSLSGAGALAQPPASAEEAEALLQNYFSALRAGDVDRLGNLLGGDLRARLAGLLGNPEYSFELISTYANAEFAIVDYAVHQPDSVAATVHIVLNGSERLRHRLTLQRPSASEGLQIVDTEVVP